MAPRRDPGSGYTGYPALHLETFFFKDAAEVFGSFEFLEAKLAIAEDLIHHDLDLLRAGIDVAEEIGLKSGFILAKERGRNQQSEENWGAHTVSDQDSRFRTEILFPCRPRTY